MMNIVPANNTTYYPYGDYQPWNPQPVIIQQPVIQYVPYYAAGNDIIIELLLDRIQKLEERLEALEKPDLQDRKR